MKFVLSLIQFILGFLLGVMLLAGGAGAAAYYYFAKMSENPPKPVFSEEPEAASVPEGENTAEKAENNGETSGPKESPQPAPVKEEKLEPGAYYATVTWPQGLSLRDRPSVNAQRIGGVAHKAKIVILEESNDKKWQKVRIPSSGLKGWVKAGNVKKVDN